MDSLRDAFHDGEFGLFSSPHACQRRFRDATVLCCLIIALSKWRERTKLLHHYTGQAYISRLFEVDLVVEKPDMLFHKRDPQQTCHLKARLVVLTPSRRGNIFDSTPSSAVNVICEWEEGVATAGDFR